MNREWILQHLDEAHLELTRVIADIREKPDYGSGDLIAAMSHLYFHLNTAVNARLATEEELRCFSDADFKKWSAFPIDIPLFE